MIPILYESTETAFTSNGLGRLSDCISCVVTEQRNGVYEVEFEYPITGAHFDEITEGRIIACTHDETGDVQPFDIYAHSAPIDGIVTFNAHHISYRQAGITVKPFTAGSCTEALNGIKTNSVNTNAFTYWTDKSVTGSFKVETPRPARALLCGEEGSILDVFGTAEYEFDKFAVKLHSRRGTTSGITIRYGKNLVNIEDAIDYSDSYTGVVPFWAKDNAFVNVSGWVVRSGNASYGNRDIIVPLDLSDQFENQPTASALQTLATSKLSSSNAWNPKETIKVDFVQLWQTEEYKEYAPLQRVHLCDTVSVVYPALGLTADGIKVVEIRYNVLLNRYDEMTLGDAPQSYAALIQGDTSAKLDEMMSQISGVEAEIQEAIDNATALITGGNGGYIKINYNANDEPFELLIMDSDDVNTANKLWRWNIGGLGYSKTGYNGTYGTAITMDGAIVADYITAGTLTANLIKAGLLADTSGKNTWNLETGAMTLRDATFYGTDADTTVTIGDTLEMVHASPSSTIPFVRLSDKYGVSTYDHLDLYADKIAFYRSNLPTFSISLSSGNHLEFDGYVTFDDSVTCEAEIFASEGLYVGNGGQIGAEDVNHQATIVRSTLDSSCDISALVDSALNNNSTNPVENKAIYSALQNKADASVLSSYAPLDSPALTGSPTAPTPSSGDSSTALATTAFVQDAVSGATTSGYSGSLSEYRTTSLWGALVGNSYVYASGLIGSNDSNVWTNGLLTRHSGTIGSNVKIAAPFITVDVSAALSINANSYASGTITLVPSDFEHDGVAWRPVAISSYTTTGGNSANCPLYRFKLDMASGQIQYGVKNVATAAATPTITFTLLCFPAVTTS